MYDVIIIGGGPAGFTAALYCARAKLSTLLLEKMFSGGQMATTSSMENYPGFEEPISGFDLAMRMENQARKFGVIIKNEDVVDLTLDSTIKVVKTKNNIYMCKAVILCMGASPRKLGLESERRLASRGVSYCATCDGAFFSNKDVAVIGGGDTAAEDALYLARICRKVYIVHRRDSLRAAQITQQAIFNTKNIEIIWNSVVENILGEEVVEGIEVKNLKTGELFEIKLDGVFVAIGHEPNTELVKGKIELNSRGYIVTDEGMQTNMFGVYAAGDIREKPLRQVITAASDGAVAAYMAEKYISENTW